MSPLPMDSISNISLPHLRPVIDMSSITAIYTRQLLIAFPPSFVSVLLFLRHEDLFVNDCTDHHRHDEEPEDDQHASEYAAEDFDGLVV